MKKRFLKPLLLLCIMTAMFSVASVTASANTTTFGSDDYMYLSGTSSADDDYRYMLIEWNTDDSVDSATVDSNIRNSGIQIVFPSESIVAAVKNNGWDTYEIDGNTMLTLYFTPYILENVNQKATYVVKVSDAPVFAELFSEIGSARTFGGSVRFYYCDASGNKTSGELYGRALNIGQNKSGYPSSDMFTPSNVYYPLESLKVTADNIPTLPTTTAVTVPLTVTGLTKDGFDAAMPFEYVNGGDDNVGLTYMNYITKASVTDVDGKSIEGVEIINSNGSPAITIPTHIYDKISTTDLTFDGSKKECTVEYSENWQGGTLEVTYETDSTAEGEHTAHISKNGTKCDVTYTIEDAVEYYNVWVGGVQFTSENLTIDGADNPLISGNATFYPETYTLTLVQFSYTGAGGAKEDRDIPGIGLFFSNPEEDPNAPCGKLVLHGTNYIDCVSDGSLSCAVYIVGSVEISGGGSLTARASFNGVREDYDIDGVTNAIMCSSTLSVEDSTITAITDIDCDHAYGIIAGSLVLDNANITSSGDAGAFYLFSGTSFEDAIDGHKALVSNNKDGSDATEYGSGMDIAAYKYAKIEPVVIEHYDIWCGEHEFTSDNLVIDSTDNSAISGSATYDPEANTLTLNNFNYFGRGGIDGDEGIAFFYSDRDENNTLSIVLEGDNSIYVSDQNSISCAMYLAGNVSFSGTGSLILGAGPASSEYGDAMSVALYAPALLTVQDASITAISGGEDEYSFGIFAALLELDNANIVAKGHAGALYVAGIEEGETSFAQITEGHSALVSASISGADAAECPDDVTFDDLMTYKYMKIEPVETEVPEIPDIPVVNEYTITAFATEGGVAEGTAKVEEGQTVTLMASADEGYEFIGWFEGDIKVCDTEEFVVEDITEDKTYTAKFKIIEVVEPDEPAEPSSFDFESIRTGNGENITVNHENKKITVNVPEGDNLVLYVHQKDVIPGGQIRMNNYNDFKVTYDASGVYRIYTINNATVTVSAKVMIDGVTEIYDLQVNYGIIKSEFNFGEIKCDNGEKFEIDHEAQTIRIYAEKGAEYITLYKEQNTFADGGLVLTSFMGNRVKSNHTDGTYKVCFVKNKEVSVKGIITIGGVEKEYTIISVFSPDWSFNTLKAENASVAVIDHTAKTVTMDATSDSVQLFIDQTELKGNAQVWMKSYNGNKVKYNADNRTYTITKGNEDSLTVAVKVTIYGETRYYDLIINF